MQEDDPKARSERRGWALVTGASRGIGYELARVLAEAGWDAVLLARDEPRLRQVAEELEEGFGIRARVIAADLADPGAARRVFDELDGEGLRVDLLVNNAGFGSSGPFAEADLARERDMVRVNVGAVTELTGLFLPGMLERDRGGVLNVASTAAFQPGPFMAVYFASKAYVLSFTEALAEELRGTGVRATALCPGPTATSFQERADMGDSALSGQGTVGLMDPERVARAGYSGWRRGRRRVVPGVLNWLGTVAVRFVPTALVLRAVGWLQGRGG